VSRQCPATHRTRSGFVFCTLDAGHEGEHKGFRKRWPNAAPPAPSLKLDMGEGWMRGTTDDDTPWRSPAAGSAATSGEE
jgi:hypothetical protein